MAYEIGTATNYKNLLERLQDFLNNPGRTISSGDTSISELDPMPSGEFWQINRWNTDFDGNGNYEMMLQGPGSSGQDEIHIGVQTLFDVGADEYNWKMFGMTGYISGQDAENQPGCTQGCWPKLLLWNSSIDYWFFGNGRRFVVIAKVSMLYLGFALPYGLPTQFPYPLVVGGSFSGSGTDRYSSIADPHRGFPNPYGEGEGVCIANPNVDISDPSSLKVLQGTSWIKFRGRTNPTTYYSDNCIWPYNCSSYSPSSVSPYNIFSTGLRENLDGSYPIFPLIIMINNPNNHIFGELQGCYAVPGFGGITAEDEFIINGDTYIAFPIVPNADRGDFMCIKKE
jgi:hypothetical protein